jgi:5-methylcytosine-specific restriction endonuclease McrA
MKEQTRQEWEQLFIDKMKTVHKRNIAARAKKFLRKLDNVKNGMVARSKKEGVKCTITLQEIRQIAYDAYGTECKYSKRQLISDNMVFDHIIPMSKDGPSTKDNIQAISKFANNLKGSLKEEHMYLLLEWLDKLPEEFRKDITIRLAGGKR